MKFFVISLLLGSLLLAKDGEVLYNSYCSACHSVDGKGAGNGAFPPLANSEWLQGDSARSIQVILHGLQGEIEVAGKSYNLVMPPQGGTLSDEQIAKIVTYVRSAWGNNAASVTTEQVSEQRQRTKNRETMWEAAELLEEHPLPIIEGPIKDLLSYAYVGKKIKTIEELRKDTKYDVEEEKSGFLNLGQAGAYSNFAMRWIGRLEIEEQGEYTFSYFSKQQGTVKINGEEVIFHKNRKAPTTAKVPLNKGSNDIEVEYLNSGRLGELELFYEDTKGGKHMLSKKPVQRVDKPIMLKAENKEPVIYRNFFTDVNPRAIAVGYPEQVNLVFDADIMALRFMWLGGFVNAGVHWINRGNKEAAAPAGIQTQYLNNKPMLTLKGSVLKAEFKGYQLNAKRQPIFY